MQSSYLHDIAPGVAASTGAKVLGMNHQHERDPKQLVFHPQNAGEYDIPATIGGANLANQFGYRPKYRDYQCGACGAHTAGRLLCDVARDDGATVSWCLCACDRREPTIIVEREGMMISQMPPLQSYKANTKWPQDLQDLYTEAAKSFGAGAFTACAMVCRKVLMATACHKGDSDGKTFSQYVDYITDIVLTYPPAKSSIDKIRGIGNEANHDVSFVPQADAHRAMEIVTYMLNAIYAFPDAGT